MHRHRVTGLGYERRDSEAIDLSPSISCYQVRTDHPNNYILNLAVLLLYHYKMEPLLYECNKYHVLH